MSSLGFLLGSSAPEGFFRASHERAPALLEGRDEEGGPVLSNARLRLLLALGWIRCPLLRLERAGEDLPEAAFSSGLRFGAHAVDGLAEPEAVARLLASGASLEALHVERAWRPLADVCAGLSRELHAAVTAHAWLLPLAEARVGSDAALLAPRVARVDTFLVQLAGTTRCRVWRGPQDLPLRERPTTEQAGRAACDVPPLLTAVMRPGERVYVPRGFVYAREACSAEAPAFAEDSLGLAVELASPTWVNVFGALLKTSLARLITDPRLRRGLGPDEAPTSEDRAALGAQLARDLRFGDAAWMLVQEASMKQGPSRAGALAASLQREGIGP